MQDLSSTTLLRELVRIPSVSSLSNRPIIEFVKSILAPRGWHTRELPYLDSNGVEKVNLIATPPGQSADDFSVDLAFVCHTDTVPYNPAWTGAVNPRLENGNLHGCGACDVKGFLACLLSALASIPATGLAQKIAIVLTAEEEIGCIGAKHLLSTGLLRARHIVVGEPTSLRPARAGKGYGLAEVRVFGKEAHSAHPSQGNSAIFRAARFIEKIEQLANSLQQSPHPGSEIFDPPYTTLNVGTISGGTAKNIVPAECRFLLEWRPVPADTRGAIPKAIRKTADQLNSEDPSFRCEIDVLRDDPGFETPADSPLLRRWMELSQRQPIGVSFGTEAPQMKTIAEQVIVVGPGDMRTAHSDRECVPLTELELCVAYLRELVSHPIEAPR